MKKEMTIVITTESDDKIKGITQGFKTIFPECEIVVYKSKADSGVPDQPFGKETYVGAKNRIEFTIQKFKEKLEGQDVKINYYVSCEAGIDDSIPDEYFSEQVVCIYNVESNRYFFGKSSAWCIPESDIEYVRKYGLDEYLKSKGCKGLSDVIDGKYISRSQAITEGTIGALASETITKNRGRKIDEGCVDKC